MAGKGMRTDKSIANKVALTCYQVVAFILTIAYIVEFLKGLRSIGYVIFFVIIVFIPPIAGCIAYKKNRDTEIVRFLVGYGYAVTYIFAMFTTQNPLTFTYAIPMIFAISVYNNFGFCLRVNVGIIIVNITQIIYFMYKGLYTWEVNSSSIEIQISLMLLTTIFSMYTSKMRENINNQKVRAIKDNGEKTEAMLNNVMNISNRMIVDINDMSGRVDELSEAVMSTKEAMSEVNSGSADTADAVQRQLDQTEQIQRQVESVEKDTTEISDGMKLTMDAVATGNDNVRILVDKVDESMEAGKEVTRQMEALGEMVNRMNSIVDIITEITTQTSLLALNASIEAARAGEAGKGFAVVASEISKMADETQGATVKITNLIEEVSGAINGVIRVSTDMVSMIDDEHKATANTAESFITIENNANHIFESSNDLVNNVKKLAEANKEIVDSVSTISAITEEVAAHASDTYEISEKNSDIVAEIVNLSENLKVLATQLNQ